MEKLNRLSVLGCGWLGLPLASHFVEKGWKVKGTTTRNEKLSKLQVSGIEPYLIQLNPTFEGDRSLFKSDILFLNVPPRNRDGEDDFHINQMKSLREIVLQSDIQWVILASSTGVYPNLEKVVKEEDASPNETSRGGVNLIEVEKLWRNQADFDTTILRFGGLYGPEREPGRFFAGRENIPGGKNPVNMIHLEDCIGVVETLIELDLRNDTFNVCSPNHIPRKVFYELQAKKLGIDPPTFLDDFTPWKEVSAQKLIEQTAYQFKY